MVGQHELAELAPRDVVAKAIVRQMAATGSDHVFLDARHLGREFLAERFPTISKALAQNGFDLAEDLVPVAPAQHYHSGGVRVGLSGRSSLGGLYAVGEVSCTGVHGANRLASNSLLEGLVFAHRIADDVTARVEAGELPRADPVERDGAAALVAGSRRPRVQQAATSGPGVIRDAAGLAAAAATLAPGEHPPRRRRPRPRPSGRPRTCTRWPGCSPSPRPCARRPGAGTSARTTRAPTTPAGAAAPTSCSSPTARSGRGSSGSDHPFGRTAAGPAAPGGWQTAPMGRHSPSPPDVVRLVRRGPGLGARDARGARRRRAVAGVGRRDGQLRRLRGPRRQPRPRRHHPVHDPGRLAPQRRGGRPRPRACSPACRSCRWCSPTSRAGSAPPSRCSSRWCATAPSSRPARCSPASTGRPRCC